MEFGFNELIVDCFAKAKKPANGDNNNKESIADSSLQSMALVSAPKSRVFFSSKSQWKDLQ